MMIHFPSSLHTSGGLPKRTDSLNATQQKAPSHQIFLTIEEELHDARRVHSHGQEEDLRLALNMLIERLCQLSNMLSDAYKTNADLEVQLNVAKSNLKLVISNNEMLEDALKQRDTTAQSVGWRRTSARAHSTDDALQQAGEHSATAPIDSSAPENNRFFRFKFTPSSPHMSSSRPSTPHDGRSPALPSTHLNSASMPALNVTQANKEKEQLGELEKELEKEKKARVAAKKEKEALEAELESLSQALFEEANKMVATERMRRADAEEELKEAKLEKEALRSALRLLEGQNSSGTDLDGYPYMPTANSEVVHEPKPSQSIPSSTSSSSETPVQDLPPQLASTSTSSSSTSSPASQHLPPSLSSLPHQATRAPLPPPAPLEVPTTPFNYADFEGPPTITPGVTTLTPRPNTNSVPGPALSILKLSSAEGDEIALPSAPEVDPQSSVEPKPTALSQSPHQSTSGWTSPEDKHRPPLLNIPRGHDPWADAVSISES